VIFYHVSPYDESVPVTEDPSESDVKSADSIHVLWSAKLTKFVRIIAYLASETTTPQIDMRSLNKFTSITLTSPRPNVPVSKRIAGCTSIICWTSRHGRRSQHGDRASRSSRAHCDRDHVGCRGANLERSLTARAANEARDAAKQCA